MFGLAEFYHGQRKSARLRMVAGTTLRRDEEFLSGAKNEKLFPLHVRLRLDGVK
jgi:hypothetical protein